MLRARARVQDSPIPQAFGFGVNLSGHLAYPDVGQIVYYLP